MKNNTLKVENNIFKFNGVIGRKYFILSIIPIMLYNLFLEFNVILFREYALQDLDYKFILIFLLLLIPPYLYLKLGILTKRISDICGTRNNSFNKAALIYALSIVSKGVIGLIAIIYLSIKKGKITNNIEEEELEEKGNFAVNLQKCPSCHENIKEASAYCTNCGICLNGTERDKQNEMY